MFAPAEIAPLEAEIAPQILQVTKSPLGAISPTFMTTA